MQSMNYYGTSNIPYLPVHDVHDSTKYKRVMGCPMGYLLEYICGFKHTIPNEHLVFGRAMAGAHDLLCQYKGSPPNAYNDLAVALAQTEFKRIYLEAIPDAAAQIEDPLYPHDESNLKSLVRGLAEIEAYALNFRNDAFTVITTEACLRVPIDEHGTIFVVNSDSLVYDPHSTCAYWTKEDKTAGFLNPYTFKPKRAVWEAQWTNDFQIGANAYAQYVHARAQDIAPSKCKGVLINGMLLYKNKTDYARIHKYRTVAQHQRWLGEARYWSTCLKANVDALAKVKPTDDALTCFPRNPSSCSQYGCKHPKLCALANPLVHTPKWFDNATLADDELTILGANPPEGYKVEHWDPQHRLKEDTLA